MHRKRMYVSENARYTEFSLVSMNDFYIAIQNRSDSIGAFRFSLTAFGVANRNNKTCSYSDVFLQ